MTLSLEVQPVANSLKPVILFHALEVADQQHLSAHYWRWHQLFDHDPNARITQHPDAVFAELVAITPPSDRDMLRRLAKPAPTVVLCEAVLGNMSQALGILVPKSMTLQKAGGFGPAVELHGYRLAGNRFLGNPSCELSQQMISACAEFVREERSTYLLIEDIEQQDPLLAAAQSLTTNGFQVFSPTGIQERLKIEFPAKADDYWTKFSSKTRNTFRRKQKKIGQTRLVRVTEPDQIAEFLEVAHAISQNTWQSQKLGLRVCNNEAEIRYFTILTTQQSLRSYLLYIDEQPAAFLIGTQHKGIFNYEEVGYDRKFSDHSPGQVLLLMVLEDMLQNNPPRVFDFGGGDADYKRLFATTTSTSGNVWIVPPGFGPQTCVKYLAACRWVDGKLRTFAKRLGLTTTLRQLIRGKRSHAAVSSTENENSETPS